MAEATKHPAKFSPAIVALAGAMLEKYHVVGTVLDPFAGVGTIHKLERPGIVTIGVEIEPEWASQHPRTVVGDVMALPMARGSVAAIVTSPAYGNRFADHHEAKDGSRRHTYRHYLGRMPSPHASTTLHWGPHYRRFHRRAYESCYEVLADRGLVVVNVSNFIRDGREMRVSEWTRRTWMALGCRWLETFEVPTKRLKHGANADARVTAEHIHVLRKVARGDGVGGQGWEQLTLPFEGWEGGHVTSR